MNVVKTTAEAYRELPRRTRTDLLRFFLLRSVETNPTNIAIVAAERFGISRQAVNRQLARLVADGVLSVEGATKGRVYRLKELASHSEALHVSPALHEDEVWTSHFAPLIEGLPENVKRICYYGFTEMLNNVIDHSESAEVRLTLTRNAAKLDLKIADDGIGIFNKIQQAFDLDTPRIAVFELTKGKFTTDPDRHTGEGIFFTSRMFDRFSIMSGEFYLAHNRGKADWLLEDRNDRTPGTYVRLIIDPQTLHTIEEVLTHYATEQDDYAFNRTTIAISLALADGEQLISRSQAKRISARLDKFKEAILNFEGISAIGPAFADELFRVFANQHPTVSLVPINANEDVTRMIRRASEAGAGSSPEPNSEAATKPKG